MICSDALACFSRFLGSSSKLGRSFSVPCFRSHSSVHALTYSIHCSSCFWLTKILYYRILTIKLVYQIKKGTTMETILYSTKPWRASE